MAGETEAQRGGHKAKGKTHGLLARPPFCNGGTREDPLNLSNAGVDAEEMQKEMEAEANEIQGHMPKNPKDPLGIEKTAKKRQIRDENEHQNKKIKLSEEAVTSEEKTEPTEQTSATAEETPEEAAARKKREYKEHMKQKLKYGNFTQYYGTRLTSGETDPRLAKMPKEWFFKKNVLDIGCNVGYLTLSIAKNYEPRRILGIDIDDHLVGVARKNIRHYCDTQTEFAGKFPASFSNNMGPISQQTLSFSTKFPDNIWFRTENYVLEYDEFLDMIEPEYHIILALSITKWIHLNWGDAGLRRFFRRAFHHLHPGGMFILEPQGFETYKKRAKERKEAWAIYKNIEFKPENFKDYLIKEVGFERCEELGESETQKKGFARPIEVYYKPREVKKKAQKSS